MIHSVSLSRPVALLSPPGISQGYYETRTPPAAPRPAALLDAGGCPPEFDPSSPYGAADRVSRNGVVYECKRDAHLSRYCSTAGFEPGADGILGAAAALAWDVVGYCSGTAAPTGAPNFVALERVGECPPERWSVRTAGNAYGEGDRVSKDGLVFSCKVGAHVVSSCARDGSRSLCAT